MEKKANIYVKASAHDHLHALLRFFPDWTGLFQNDNAPYQRGLSSDPTDWIGMTMMLATCHDWLST